MAPPHFNSIGSLVATELSRVSIPDSQMNSSLCGRGGWLRIDLEWSPSCFLATLQETNISPLKETLGPDDFPPVAGICEGQP